MSEHEELAQWLDDLADDYDDLYRPRPGLQLYRAAALLREAALLRQPAPAPAPAADGEREELIDWLDSTGELAGGASIEEAKRYWRAAALLREARPQPVPAAAPTPDDFRRWWRETGLNDFGPTPEMLLIASAFAEAWAARCAQPIPQPVPVRPWERPGWCDAKGRCWWFAPTEAIPGGFRSAGWSLYAPAPADEDTHCLPHWAISQPPQGGEVEV